MTPGRWTEWPWPKDTLDGPEARIGEVACRVVSLAAQLDSKRGYATGAGAAPRPQDAADLALLERFAGA